MGDLMRRVLTLAGVLIGFPLAGLRGACAGFAVANVIVLAIGLSGAWRYLLWSALDLRRSYLAPYLRTGTSFAAGNLLLALAQRSGETVVRLATANYMQVGYYGAAYSIYLTGAHALWQGALVLRAAAGGPAHDGASVQVTSWLERLLKWMFVVASLASLATLLVGDDSGAAGAWRGLSAGGRLPVAAVAGAVRAGGGQHRPAQRADAGSSGPVGDGGRRGAGAVLGPRHACWPPASARSAWPWPRWPARSGTPPSSRGASTPNCPYSPRPALTAAGLALPLVPLALLRGSWRVNAVLLAVAVVGLHGLVALAPRHHGRRDCSASPCDATGQAVRSLPA